MKTNPISANIINLLSESPASSKASGTEDGSFSDILTDAMNTVSETDMVDKTSSLEVLSGQADDFAGLMLDAQKAEIALNLALQLRNKVLDAYKEIMNMQI